MSDVWQGPGWWLASDGKWYPADAEPGAVYEGDLSSSEAPAASAAVVTDPAPPLVEAPPSEPASAPTSGFDGDPFSQMPEPSVETEPVVEPEVDPSPTSGGWQSVADAPSASPSPVEDDVVSAIVEEDGWTSAYEERQAGSEVLEEADPAPTLMPTIELPDVDVPEVASPDAEIPDVAIPDAEMPDIEIPVAETPNVPEVEIPEVAEVTAPTFTPLTGAALPDVDLPEVGVPEVELPDVEIPEVDLASPTTAIPEVELPEVEIPEVEVPEVEVPEVDLAAPTTLSPEVDVPPVEIPEVAAPLLGNDIPVIEPPTSVTPEPDGNAIERQDAWRKPSVTEAPTSRIEGSAGTIGTPDVVDLAIPEEPVDHHERSSSLPWKLIGGVIAGLLGVILIAWLVATLFSDSGSGTTATDDTDVPDVTETTEPGTDGSSSDTAATSDPATTDGGTDPDENDDLVSVFSLRAGDCIVGDIGAGQVTKVEKVDCEQEHNFEIYREALIDSTITTFDATAISAYAEEVCRTSLAAYIPADDDRGLKFKFLQPTEDSWNQEEDPDRVITCLLFDDDAPLIGRAAE